MGSLALRPGDSLTILEDGFVNRLQDAQFPSLLLFKLRDLDFYPHGTLTHCSCQPSLDAHLPVQISTSSWIIEKMLLARCPRVELRAGASSQSPIHLKECCPVSTRSMKG